MIRQLILGIQKQRTLLSVVLLFNCSASYAQQPVIEEIDKQQGALREVVTLKGSGFGTNATQLQVWFGATQGSIQSITDQLVEVTVPLGVTYDQVYLTRTSSGLSSHSPKSFLYSFGGVPGISASNFSSQIDFQGQSGLYDLCLCDLNNDGKVDITTANDNDNAIAFFQNGSNVGSFILPKLATSIAAHSFHATCGDLNGDGRPDLIISEGGEGARLFILKNNGAYSFSLLTITLSGRKPKHAEIADLDRDGKPEIVVTDQKSASLIILKNQSTLAALSFASPQVIAIPGASSADGLDLADIDGDNLPDLVTSQFLTTNSNLFVFKNTSSTGSVTFNAPTVLTISNTVVNIKIGDLDGDAKPDLAATQLLGSGISVFLNQSTTTQLQFNTPIAMATDERPWGIDFGDLDGDGKPDIVTASITKKSITVLNNLSTPGNLSFQSTTLPTNFINRHVRIGDLDNDGKPDIVFTSIDDNNAGIPASKISVIRNKTCLKPTLSPEGPLTICTGFPLELKSSEGDGSTYEWRRNGSIVSTGTDSFLAITLPGNYSVTVIAEGGTCSQVSEEVTVTVAAGSLTGTAVASNNGPVCFGDDLQLSVNNVGASEYRWSGPANYTSTGLTPVVVSDFKLENSGRYEVEVYVGGCLAQKSSTLVEAISIPQFSLTASGGHLFCAGGTKTISLSPTTAGFTYKWFEQTSGELAGETGSSYVASASGEYWAEITSLLNPGCQPQETASLELIELNAIEADFTNTPLEGCLGQPVIFTNQSLSDSRSTAVYSWSFGDATSSSDENPSHSYATTGVKSVKLSVTYAGGICLNEETKLITINAVPTIFITNPDNRFSICTDESLEMTVSGGPYTSYTWSNGTSAETTTIETPGNLSVTVITASGCSASATVTIGSFPDPTIILVAEPAEISLGTSSQLTATGLLSYVWSPAETLSDATIPNPVASPLVTTVYTVSGADTNGCEGDASVEVKIKGENIASLLNPANSFSPNGDAQNQLWLVENILTFSQCGVTIYDDKGVKVFEAKPYLNSWDGTNNGRQLPQGVYYYIIRCDGQENSPRSGSITLLR